MDRQQELPLDDNEKFARIRSLYLPGLSAQRRGRVIKLLEVLHVALRRGNEPLRELEQTELAYLMNCSVSTLWRVLRDAKSCGVVQVVENFDQGCRGRNRYGIDWYQVRKNQRISASGQSEETFGHFERTFLQNDRTLMQNDRTYKDKVLKENTRNKPSTSTSTSSAVSAASEWEVVEEDLFRLGMGRASEALRLARSRGSSPQRVRALLAHFAAQRPSWGIGALYRRLCSDHPALAVESGWPPPSQASQAQQRTATRPRELAQAEFARQRAAEDARRAELLEQRFGALLDGMSPAERDELAESSLDEGLLWAYQHNRLNTVRVDLLEALARRHTET